MDAKLLTKFKKQLLDEKQRILNNSKLSMQHDLVISPDDMPDETDMAATEVSQNLVFQLRDRERLLLSKISDALAKMEAGSFGACEDCEEPIEMKRLEARPVSTLCISCQEVQERRDKLFA